MRRCCMATCFWWLSNVNNFQKQPFWLEHMELSELACFYPLWLCMPSCYLFYQLWLCTASWGHLSIQTVSSVYGFHYTTVMMGILYLEWCSSYWTSSLCFVLQSARHRDQSDRFVAGGAADPCVVRCGLWGAAGLTLVSTGGGAADGWSPAGQLRPAGTRSQNTQQESGGCQMAS